GSPRRLRASPFALVRRPTQPISPLAPSTTLFRSLIECNGQRLDGLGQKAVRPARRQFQVVFQDPFGSLSPRMSIAQIISEGLEIHRIGTPEEREQMVIQALQEVGLDPDSRHRYPHEFS